jgi:ubiquinone/menaquinone biosynthesis C-methylase UbiE
MIDYSSASKTYDNTRRQDDAVIGLMEARGAFAKGTRVLDFGCGTGNYLESISARFDCELYGLEPSDGMREKARAKNPGLRIEKGDHGHIPFDDAFFDLAYMTDVIHHVPDLGLLFESLFRKLRLGGRACVVTESWGQIDRRWYNAYFPSLAANEKSRYPDVDEIAQRAAMAGFALAFVDSMESPGPHALDESFLRMVGEKNYSMFRLLGGDEYFAGFAALRRDKGKSFASPGAGESLVWLERGGTPWT